VLKLESVRRKKDFVTWLAVILFTGTIAFEVLLVTWLPVHFRTASFWEKEAALDEMIELEDNLRANLSTILQQQTGNEAGEIQLALDSLDDLARYLRDYGREMTKEQINEMNSSLITYEMIYNKLRRKEFYTRQDVINPDKFLDGLLKKAEGANKK
jgi:hypothetical protein